MSNSTIVLVDKYTSEVVINISESTLVLTESTSTAVVSEVTNTEVLSLGIQGPAGAGGASSYTNLNPVPEDIGGISVGDTFDTVYLPDMWDKLLYPYQEPSFSGFSLSGKPTELEVGNAFTGGIKTFTWSTLESSNVEVDSISVSASTAGILAIDLSDDSSELVDIGPDLNYASIHTEVWTITGTNTESNSFNRTTSLTWKWPIYFGHSSNESLTENEIEALISKSLEIDRIRNYTVADAGYKYLCWPVIFGVYASIKDLNTGQNVAMELPITTSVTNSFGVVADYYVFRTTNILNGSLTMVIT